MFAEEMGMFEDEGRMIELAAPLHDLGKIAIPDALLMKPGPLTDEETRLMRRHPEIGHELPSGRARKVTARRSSTVVPPSPTMAIGPKSLLRVNPTTTSSPPRSILC